VQNNAKYGTEVRMETEDIYIETVQKTTKNRRATRSGHIKMKQIKYGENRSVQFLIYIYDDIEKGNNIQEDGISRIYR
jgi:hypothetical protein